MRIITSNALEFICAISICFMWACSSIYVFYRGEAFDYYFGVFGILVMFLCLHWAHNVPPSPK